VTAAEGAVPSKPKPEPTELSRGFWEAAGQGSLTAQYCAGCQRYQHYPRPLCLECWGSELEWRALAGTGTLYTFSIVHRAPSKEFGGAPYAVGLVDLDEGVRMMGAITAPSLDDLNVGARVRVRFEDRDGASVPYFEVDR